MPRPLSSIPGLEFFGQWRPGKKLRTLPRHKNPGLELVLISKGELRWEIEGREFVLGADTLFFTLPWQEHGGVEEFQPSNEIFYFCVRLDRYYDRPQRRFGFHPAFGFSTSEEKSISRALTGARSQAIPAGEDVRALFRHFFRCTEQRGPLAANRAREAVKLLVLDLASREEIRKKPRPSLGDADQRVRNFVRTLADRYAEPWTLESMSAACGLARTQFARLLKRLVGDTPVTYLNRLRVAAAQKLIRETDQSITDIALQVGFNSSQYFATVFKQFTDRDARSFRTSMR
jgi:AraC family L-rhamnose operon regulatory protein RhaS